MDTTEISPEELQSYLIAKQKKKEYNRKYQQANREYFAKYHRERRARLKAKAETPDVAST